MCENHIYVLYGKISLWNSFSLVISSYLGIDMEKEANYVELRWHLIREYETNKEVRIFDQEL